MKGKIILALLLAGAILLAGCTQSNPQKAEIVGSIAFEKNSPCGKQSVLTLAGEKYFTSLKAEELQGLADGDQVKIAGTVTQEGECRKIAAESFQVLKRLNIIEKTATVRIDFTARIKDGNLISTSLKEVAEEAGIKASDYNFSALEFKAWNAGYLNESGRVFADVKNAVLGLRKGEEKTIEIPPERAFGPYDEKKIIKVPRTEWPLPPTVDPDIGAEVSGVFGTYAVVKSFDQNFIYFDLNPKYAGKTVQFWLKVLDFDNEGIKAFENIVEPGDAIKVDYTGETLDGNVFDSSEGKAPLGFTAGAGQMIKGFDNAVSGMKLGEEKTVTIPPEEAYGQRDESLALVLSMESEDYKTAFPTGPPPLGFETQVNVTISGQEQTRTAIVSKIDSNSITLDLNHKLAGKALKFRIKIVEIKKPE